MLNKDKFNLTKGYFTNFKQRDIIFFAVVFSISVKNDNEY